MATIPKIINGALSDELYDKCMKQAENNKGVGATQWQHLADATSRGTISPLEAYGSITAGYVPENLKIRLSYYSHLL